MRSIFTCVDLHVLVSRSINMLSVTDFDPKGIISGARVQAGLYLDMLDADRSPNAVSVHAGTSQVEVDCPPPAACPPGDLLITMVKETVILYKKEFSYPTTRHRRIPEECGSLLRQRPNTKSWSAIIQGTELTKRTSSNKQNFQVSNQNAHFSEPYNSVTAGQ